MISDRSWGEQSELTTLSFQLFYHQNYVMKKF